MEAIVAGPERRERLTAEIMTRTGIDEAMIKRLVHGFYAKVRADAVLGPILRSGSGIGSRSRADVRVLVIGRVMTGRYHGTPMAKHLPLPVDGEHFDRWLGLFEQTAREIAAEAEAHFVERARRIASSLELGMPAPTASCSATGNDFDVTRQEQSNGLSCTYRDKQGAGRSVFRQQPGADARMGLC